jgi:hypothetical protein
MSTVAVVVIVAVVLVAALAIGGAVANARRQARRGDFGESVDEVNRALASAHAADRGWEPDALTAAARRAFEAERPGTTIRGQALIQVIDPAGTDDDKAVFRFVTDQGTSHLTLGRLGGEWVSEGIE